MANDGYENLIGNAKRLRVRGVRINDEDVERIVERIIERRRGAVGRLWNRHPKRRRPKRLCG